MKREKRRTDCKVLRHISERLSAKLERQVWNDNYFNKICNYIIKM